MKWLLIFYNMNLIIHHLIIFPKKRKKKLFLVRRTVGIYSPHHFKYTARQREARHHVVRYITSSHSWESPVWSLFHGFVCLDPTYKWDDAVFVYLWLTSLNALRFHTIANGRISFFNTPKSWVPKSPWTATAAMKLKEARSLEEKLWPT